MTNDNKIYYEELVRQALLGVVRDVLLDAAEHGLPGDHHFYIAFNTRDPGVRIPKFLMEKYPDEMTIVLQHRFWDLKVEDEYFEVKLSFNQQPQLLVIPFDALVGFVDPSVRFALQFKETDGEGEGGANLPATAKSGLSAGPGDEGEAAAPAPTPAKGAKDNVVTLDAFRKKS